MNIKKVKEKCVRNMNNKNQITLFKSHKRRNGY